jgi:hypothetical protein
VHNRHRDMQSSTSSDLQCVWPFLHRFFRNQSTFKLLSRSATNSPQVRFRDFRIPLPPMKRESSYEYNNGHAQAARLTFNSSSVDLQLPRDDVLVVVRVISDKPSLYMRNAW